MESRNFLVRLDEIFAAFGKKSPGRRISDAIWRKVCDLPDGFMAYAQARLEEMDKLPTNLGLYLTAEILPEYRARRGLDRAADQTCPECKGIGYILAWNEREYSYLHRCVCNGGTWTRERLLEKGMKLTDPAFERCKNSMPRTPEMRRALGSLGADFPVRQRHAEYMQEVEYD